MKSLLFASAAVLAIATAPAMATPGGALLAGGQQAGESDVTQVHFRHSACRRGVRGWHYHHRGHRHACGPNPGRGWIWRFGDGRWGWWHHRDRRWHDRH